jgi:hypothetical protein
MRKLRISAVLLVALVTLVTIGDAQAPVSLVNPSPVDGTTNNALVELAPTATAGVSVSPCNVLSAASTTPTNCKASAAGLYGFEFYNTTTTSYFFNLFNSASAPTCGSGTNFVRSIPIPAASASGLVGGITFFEPIPVAYSNGLSFCISTGANTSTAAAVGIYGELKYH